jgi:hypothetical protein
MRKLDCRSNSRIRLNIRAYRNYPPNLHLNRNDPLRCVTYKPPKVQPRHIRLLDLSLNLRRNSSNIKCRYNLNPPIRKRHNK